MSREYMIKSLQNIGLFYNFEKYTDKQIYYIYIKCIDK